MERSSKVGASTPCQEYLEIKRTGRRVPFSAVMRRQAWELRTDWDRRLHHAGVVDFPDVIRRARDFAIHIM
ncbi:MAG: hypothetical protein OXI96_09670 [Acidimicrobiaceae bacterium]|nr:hypothetical protein [Acidimicrobiaceae bacterium]